MKALIDTGAQANILKASLVENKVAQCAREPITMIAANQGNIAGGDREVVTTLGFRQKSGDQVLPDLWQIDCTMYLADIGIDIIFS